MDDAGRGTCITRSIGFSGANIVQTSRGSSGGEAKLAIGDKDEAESSVGEVKLTIGDEGETEFAVSDGSEAEHTAGGDGKAKLAADAEQMPKTQSSPLQVQELVQAQVHA